MTTWWDPSFNDDSGEGMQFTPDSPAPVPEYPRKRRCTHDQTEVTLPSGVRVFGSSMWGSKSFVPDLALWLDPAPVAKTLAVSLYIPWEDHGLPLCDPHMARATIKAMYGMARDGYVVEVGCYAGHGRTTTVLAAMLKLDGFEGNPFAYLADAYCPLAVQDVTMPQVRWVERFAI